MSELIEWGCFVRELRDEPSVIIEHPHDPLCVFQRSWVFQGAQRLHFLGYGFDSVDTYGVPKVSDLPLEKVRLPAVYDQVVVVENLQDLLEVGADSRLPRTPRHHRGRRRPFCL